MKIENKYKSLCVLRDKKIRMLLHSNWTFMFAKLNSPKDLAVFLGVFFFSFKWPWNLNARTWWWHCLGNRSSNNNNNNTHTKKWIANDSLPIRCSQFMPQMFEKRPQQNARCAFLFKSFLAQVNKWNETFRNKFGDANPCVCNGLRFSDLKYGWIWNADTHFGKKIGHFMYSHAKTTYSGQYLSRHVI